MEACLALFLDLFFFFSLFFVLSLFLGVFSGNEDRDIGY